MQKVPTSFCRFCWKMTPPVEGNCTLCGKEKYMLDIILKQLIHRGNLRRAEDRPNLDFISVRKEIYHLLATRLTNQHPESRAAYLLSPRRIMGLEKPTPSPQAKITEERKRLFLSRHRSLASQTFKEGSLSHQIILIGLARTELGYSRFIVWQDILRSLKNTWRGKKWYEQNKS